LCFASTRFVIRVLIGGRRASEAQPFDYVAFFEDRALLCAG
jgi:hypothetical protein